MKNNLKKGYLENARKKFLFLGFTIIGSLTLVAFKVSSYDFEEAKKSSIVVPEDEATIFFELPKPTPAKQKKASKAVVMSVERYDIVPEVPEELFTELAIDKTDLALGEIEPDAGDDGGEDPIIEADVKVDWSRLERTPYFSDCEDVMDREAESLCSYSKIRNLVQQNTEYPVIPREMGLSARVYVTFVIDKKGNIKDAVALNDNVHKDFIKAAIKGVESLPRMNPGTQRMRPVSVKLTIPVNFYLQ